MLPAVNPSTVAVVLGALLVNVGLHRSALHVGTHLASHRLLRVAVVLLGLQLGVQQLLHLGVGGAAVVAVTVAVTFTGTQLLGRLLGVPPARALLIATGFSICGASAVAAMDEVAGGDEDDTGVAVALVTVCGSLAIVLLPALRAPLGLDPVAFGSRVGASVHDVGQTVATASRVSRAVTSAVAVKLSWQRSPRRSCSQPRCSGSVPASSSRRCAAPAAAPWRSACCRGCWSASSPTPASDSSEASGQDPCRGQVGKLDGRFRHAASRSGAPSLCGS